MLAMQTHTCLLHAVGSLGREHMNAAVMCMLATQTHTCLRHAVGSHVVVCVANESDDKTFEESAGVVWNVLDCGILDP